MVQVTENYWLVKVAGLDSELVQVTAQLAWETGKVQALESELAKAMLRLSELEMALELAQAKLMVSE